MILFRRLVLALPVLIVIAAGCRGGDDPSADVVSPTAVIAPTVEPSSPVPTSPTAAASATEAPGTDPSLVDLDTLLVPVCRTDPFAGSSAGFGTVPRDPGSVSAVGEETLDSRGEVIVALASVLRWVDHFTAISDTAWVTAEDEQDFVAAISDEGRRLWLSCSAFAAAAPVLKTEDPFMLTATAALAERQRWLTERLEVLRTAPGSIRDDDANRVRTSTALKGLQGTLEGLAIEAGVEDRITPAPFIVPNPLLGISLDAPAGWLLIRNRTDIVLAAPASSQVEGMSGLGVPGWNFGTALRVRRLRHEAPWTLEDSASLMDSLMARFGDRVSDGRTRVDGLDAINRVYESMDDGWITVVAATVRDLQTYVLELGCPAEERESCEAALDGYVQGVEFADL